MNHQSEASIKKRVCIMRPGRQEGKTQLVCGGKTTAAGRTGINMD